jgi:hypothetical protein
MKASEVSSGESDSPVPSDNSDSRLQGPEEVSQVSGRSLLDTRPC